MTAESDGPLAFTGSVGIEGNRIRLVTDNEILAEAFRVAHHDLQEIDARGMLLMPGLINTHCHVAMTLQRSYADDITLMSWLNDYIWPFEAKQTPDEIRLGAELGIAEMLLGGVTSFVDMYWQEAFVAEAVRKTGARALLGVSYLDANMEEFRRDLEATMQKAATCSRIRVAVAPHAGYSCSEENLREGIELARRHGLFLTTHIAETQDESRIISERYGKSPVRLFDDLGALSERTIAAHCVHVDGEDILTLRDRGVTVAHNPQSNMKISSGIAPLERMRRAGVHCTVATDGCCSNNDLDLWEELRTATFLQKCATGDPCAAPAYEMLKMVTVEAARGIGCEGELGVVSEGAIADLILLDLRKPHLCPVHNLVSNLVYCAKASDVDTVIVDGEVVVSRRRVVGIDLDGVMDQVQHHALDIARRTRG